MKAYRIAMLLCLMQPLPGAADEFEETETVIDTQERAALTAAQGYDEAAQYPIRDGHRVRFLYGGGKPALICAPLRVCLIELQNGEVIAPGGLHVGDSIRWNVDGAIGGNSTILIIKPVAPNLTTTMSIITDRRTYYLDLKSHETEYMPAIAWVYPTDLDLTLRNIAGTQRQERAERALPDTGEDITQLDFDYVVSDCKCPWQPARVYHNGQQTVIQLSDSADQAELPALLVLSGKTEGLVNYRVQGKRYIVDAVFDAAVLLAGVGRDQTRATIRRMQ